VRLEPVRDIAGRDALLAGSLGALEAAPGWPHPDTEAGLSFLSSGGLVFLIIDDDGRIAGECGTKTPPDQRGAVEIGYGLAPLSRGRGLGTAAVCSLLDVLAGLPAVAAVEAEVHVGNPASWRILYRLGFTATGEPTRGYQRYQLALTGAA
jgi:RimJ/RimL family protein N-acetyltransferase